MAHLTAEPVNLYQVMDQLTSTFPSRVTPPGWGLAAQSQGDGYCYIVDPFNIFTDDEIHTAAGEVTYDPDYGADPDWLFLQNDAIGDLDILRQSVDPNVAMLATIVRCMMRQNVAVDAPPTFPPNRST